MTFQLTTDQIQKYGLQARNSVATVTQNCGEIIDTFEGLLNDYAGLPWDSDYADRYGRIQIRVGPNGEEKHYIFKIDSELVEGFDDDGEVWIDLSFDQFNNTNKQHGITTVSYGPQDSLQKIRIIGPNDPAQQETEEYQFDITT